MINFKILLTIILSSILILSACKKDDSNIPEEPENIYPYDLINPSIGELRSFFEDGYNVIDGNVELNNIDSLGSLLTLSNVRKITGYFMIKNNYNIDSFNGLIKLKTIGVSFIIHRNRGDFTNLEGLNNLESVSDGLIISENSGLTSLVGLNSLHSTSSGIVIEHNDGLINLGGLSELNSVANLLIINNHNLKNLDGLNNIQSISNNLTIFDNPNLIDFCSIRNVLAINGVDGAISFHSNLFNPTVEDIIAGNCSRYLQ